MGIEEEKIDQIIDAHGETVDALKADIQETKELNKKIDDLSKENEELKKIEIPKDKSEEIEKLTKEIEEFKKKETLGVKQTAYRKLLKEAGIDEKRYNSIMKLTDFEKFEIDGETIKNKDELVTKVKEDYSDFIIEVDTEAHDPVKNVNKSLKKDPSEMDYAEYKAWRSQEGGK